ncbi:hypothetical protein [Nocardiopsis sp. MG754419]|uniref:hypothetical protein n=1 Tax=Nocardiopsis sp. MG754419 TaxID=2259865 RepID=UPI001BA81FA3|nr:hypothetical protein [Nocardiopsis sp. MG754419]MBR8743782.1 hypothetical protein [Nocardiopsis sp. MG754419]
MLRLVRPAATAATLTLLAAGVAAPAHADAPPQADDSSFLSQVECGSSGGQGCSIMLTWMQSQQGRPGGGSDGAGGTEGAGEAGAGAGDPDGTDWDAMDWDSIDWSLVDWDSIDWDEIDYDEEEDGSDPVSSVRRAMGSFQLPPPEISTSPGEDSLVLVNTPVWLWLDSEQWEPTGTSAEVADWSFTLTASPVSTVWTLGDGTTVRCDGAGTPFDADTHAADAASPDCGHVYTLPSDTQEGGVYTVGVQVGWDVDWEATGGGSGALNRLTTTSEIQLPVAESHGLVTD